MALHPLGIRFETKIGLAKPSRVLIFVACPGRALAVAMVVVMAVALVRPGGSNAQKNVLARHLPSHCETLARLGLGLLIFLIFVFLASHEQVFGRGQMTISALAVFKRLESERFVRTRRHFTKRVRFVTALVIFGRRLRPGIITKKRVWPQRGTIYFLVFRMNLAGGGF